MASLAGKVALITGVGQNIGLATARLLASRGASIAVNNFQPAIASGVAAELGATTRSLAVPSDVTQRETVEGIIDSTVANQGRLDILAGRPLPAQH